MHPLGFISGAATLFGGGQKDVAREVFSNGYLRDVSIGKGATEVDVVAVTNVGVVYSAVFVEILIKDNADVLRTGREQFGQTFPEVALIVGDVVADEVHQHRFTAAGECVFAIVEVGRGEVDGFDFAAAAGTGGGHLGDGCGG